MAKLSVELQRFFLNTDGENEPQESRPSITPNEILEVVGERTFGFLWVPLSLLAALPIPAISYAASLGVVILLLALQLMVGSEQPWLPKTIRKRGFERQAFQDIVRKSMPWLQRIEVVSRPRLTPVCTSRTGRAVIGFAIALMALIIMLPMFGPNALPALGVFVTGFGLLNDDGAISLLGVGFCAVAIAFTGSLIDPMRLLFGI